jgi:hypothetical protein
MKTKWPAVSCNQTYETFQTSLFLFTTAEQQYIKELINWKNKFDNKIVNIYLHYKTGSWHRHGRATWKSTSTDFILCEHTW